MLYDNETTAKKKKMTMQSWSASGQYPKNGILNVQHVQCGMSPTYVVQRAVITTTPVATLKVKVHSCCIQLFFYNMNGPLQSLCNCLLVSLDQKKNKIKIIPECEKFTKLPRARELEAAILEQCIDYSCCIDAQNAAAEAFECDCVKCNVTGQPGGFL